MKTKKKIFLTGSDGFIGSFLTKELEKIYTVIGSDITKGDDLNNDN